MKTSRILSFLLVIIPTILLSTSCSILSNTNEIALKCRQTSKFITYSPNAGKSVNNKIYNTTYLINLKEKKVQSYTDTSIIPQEDVNFAPKSINFKNYSRDLIKGSINYRINRETLKIQIAGRNTVFDIEQSISGEGICKKIPYPPMVSSKNKI
jgi:hypothetical protein